MIIYNETNQHFRLSVSKKSVGLSVFVFRTEQGGISETF